MTYTLCTLIPCGQVVTEGQPHVTLSDGARIHMDCATRWRRGGCRTEELRPRVTARSST